MEKEKLPERKNMRWDKQDYSHPGEYMITVCTKDMKQILSRITAGNPQTVGTGVPDRPHHVNAQTVGDDIPIVPHTELTYYGKIADKYINQLNDFYKNINVIKYVIMPNHIHLLLQIPDNGQSKIHPVNANAFTGTPNRTPVPTGENRTDINRREYGDNNGANSTVSKFVSTFKRFCNKEYGENIWQARFHDHVIRDENDLIGAINYIENNPYRWIEN